jgi:hypothetical protein
MASIDQRVLQQSEYPGADEPELTWLNVAIALGFIAVDGIPQSLRRYGIF